MGDHRYERSNPLPWIEWEGGDAMDTTIEFKGRPELFRVHIAGQHVDPLSVWIEICPLRGEWQMIPVGNIELRHE